MTQSVEWLNHLSARDAENELLRCCGSTRWARGMAKARPFHNMAELLSKADEIWWSLDENAWLEAFRAHPRIGEQKASSAQSSQAAAWSAQEQSAVATASRNVVSQLDKLNHEYEERFGFIFIVCATGKSPEEMLNILEARIENDRRTELRNAAEEQRKITRLRLERLLNQ